MKTPREIILERHQAAEAKLETIRAEDLAAECAGRSTTEALPVILRKFWQETFLPWRRVWIGVGVAWVVILGVSLAASDAPQPTVAPSRPNPEVRAALQQQEQLLTQLLGLDAPPPPARSPKAPGPRSSVVPAPATEQDASDVETMRRVQVFALA